jgi:hypothetical protein
MRLYHITCLAHFQKIWTEDKYLKTVESNIGSPEVFRFDPDDDIYERAFVPLWPDALRPKKGKIPNVVSGALLKEMEEKAGHQYARATGEDFGDEIAYATGKFKMNLIVGADLEKAPESKFGDHVGPDVVWLTTDPTPVQFWAGTERVPDDLFQYSKDEILFVVDVPDEDVFKWSEWAFEQGINPIWYDSLDYVDPVTGIRESENWYVVPRRIPIEEWDAIYMAKSGQVMWLNPAKYTEVPLEYYSKKSALIMPEHEEAARKLHPAPQIYKPASLLRDII